MAEEKGWMGFAAALLVGLFIAGLVLYLAPRMAQQAPAEERTAGEDFQSIWVKTDVFVDEDSGIRIARTIAGRDTDDSSPSVHTLVIGRMVPAAQPKEGEEKPKPKRK